LKEYGRKIDRRESHGDGGKDLSLMRWKRLNSFNSGCISPYDVPIIDVNFCIRILLYPRFGRQRRRNG